MVHKELLERILTEDLDENLRNDLLRHLLFSPGMAVVPRLQEWERRLDSNAVFERMLQVAGGSIASIARLLNVSKQAINNQKTRGKISCKSIIDFHIQTGVSADWLIGSWSGGRAYVLEDKRATAVFTNAPAESPAQQYLSLAETYDQHSGNEELKWCLSKHQFCLDENSKPIPNDFGALLSLIMRYKDQSGTPDKVKNGGKRHFQVRKVLAYALGEPKLMAGLDGLVKKHTIRFKTEDYDRSGKTEFRIHSAKGVCLEVLGCWRTKKVWM